MKQKTETRHPAPPPRTGTPEPPRPPSHLVPRLALALATIALALLALASSASASKQLVNYFGTPPANVSGEKGGEFAPFSAGAVAVNQTGAGPAEAGEIYVVDGRNNRIERFARDDHGTPAPYDDTFSFVSAWGAGVQSGGSEYQVCTVAAECRAGTPAGGDGATSGNGDLGKEPKGIAVDQDTGDVYVADAGNNRVNQYSGDGTFIRSFGYDVAESGPGNLPGAAEQQKVTVKASGGKFSLIFRGQTTGAKGRGYTTKGSKTITELTTTSGAFAVGQGFSAFSNGQSNPSGEPLAYVTDWIPAGTTITKVEPGKLIISKAATENDTGNNAGVPLFGDNLPFNASAAELETSLDAVPTIGGVGGSVHVTRLEKSAEEFEYTIDYGGALAGTDLPDLVPSTGGLTIGSGEPTVSVEQSVRGGAYEVCNAQAGDVCHAGDAGDGVGELGATSFEISDSLAVRPPDGNPATGTLFLADTANHRVNTYGLDGTSPSAFGSAAVFGSPSNRPSEVAVDSRGIVYASSQKNGNEIERYDTEDADGGGVGFLAPISAGVNEVQQLTIGATAGTFRLCFEGHCSGDLPFNANDSQIRAALEALPTIGPGSFACCSFGGPGDAGGTHPYEINFGGQLGARDVPQLTIEDGSVPLSGGAGAAVATTTPGQPGLLPTTDGGFGGSNGLAVESGPEGDVLYVLRTGDGNPLVQQFGPLNAPGLAAPPGADDERHGGLSSLDLNSFGGLALDEATGLLYVPDDSGGGQRADGVYVLGPVGSSLPTAQIDSVDQITARSALVHATINPNGPPALAYRLEYSAADGATWEQTSEVVLGSQETPQSVEVPLQLLEPGTEYKLRLIAKRPFLAPVTDEKTFTTLPSAPEVETVGSPVRTATSARLEGRINPAGNPATYHFQYGDQGPCDANPCSSTPNKPAGSADSIELLSEWVEQLVPSTTYHYRLVGESECEPLANPGHICVGTGEDMTLTTPSDAPLSHGGFPGPPGSDRAYEQVTTPDIGGNPLGPATTVSENGERALYQVEGGTPFTEAGSSFGSLLFAQRQETAPHEGSWQTRQITPPRSQLIGAEWNQTEATPDLSDFLSEDYEFTTEKANVWRFGPGLAPQELFQSTPATTFGAYQGIGFSADGSRAVMLVHGGELDLAYPAAAPKENLYDITSGTPQLLSLLPGNEVAACGLLNGSSLPSYLAHWISADGSRVFFASQGNNCSGPEELYMREVEAHQTKLISGPPLSGADCGAIFLRSTPGAAFFWTESRLAANDTAPPKCTGGSSEGPVLDGDVYRYDLGDGSLRCVTCVVPGLTADVNNSVAAGGGSKSSEIAVAPDGSRVYFDARTPLLPGAPPDSLYRVTVATGNLSYVGPSAEVKPEAAHPMSADGSVIVFASKEAALNPLGGTNNGATKQYYRYDDNDRSLICVSCFPHGAAPAGAAALASNHSIPALSADGSDLAFTTPTPLLGADQNTDATEPERGTDAYEWRHGRLLLITDGLTAWPKETDPEVRGIGASGGDVFFAAPAELTPDALDASIRLYDARIGGGFQFPQAAAPCPLEVCQGTPQGTPEEAPPGSASFSGPGNLVSVLPTALAPKRKIASQLRAAELAKALRACRRAKRHSPVKRKRCEAAARKRYGTKSKGKAKRAVANRDRRIAR